MNSDPPGLLLRAVALAAEHRDQRRKDAGAAPYINHPIELASLPKQQGVDDIAVLCAALLHDTIKDTNTTADELPAPECLNRGGRGDMTRQSASATRVP